MTMPENLPIDTATWMRLQIIIATTRAVAPLQDEISKLEDFACGIYGVLRNLVPHLMRSQPGLAQQLEPHWRGAALRTEELENGVRLPEPGETVELLEARTDLYQYLKELNLWPEWQDADDAPPLHIVPRKYKH